MHILFFFNFCEMGISNKHSKVNLAFIDQFFKKFFQTFIHLAWKWQLDFKNQIFFQSFK
jgi:hypothetical protein